MMTNVTFNTPTRLILSLLVLNIIDFQTTLTAIENGAVEINPLLNYLLTQTETVWVIFWFKITVISLLFIPYITVTEYHRKFQTKTMINILYILNFIYIAIIISTLFKNLNYLS